MKSTAILPVVRVHIFSPLFERREVTESGYVQLAEVIGTCILGRWRCTLYISVRPARASD